MRGCERRIYHVKNADSPCFEEAYLVMRRSGGRKRTGPSRTLAEEAERIIRESTERVMREHRRAVIHRLTPSAAFALGAGTSSLIIGAFALIGCLW